MIAHSEGVEAAARLLAPKLLGQDPRQVYYLERLMDHTIQGHGYAKHHLTPHFGIFWANRLVSPFGCCLVVN